MPSPENLSRRLSFADAYALAVGSVIGTGIFLLPGKAAAAMGPAAVWALVIGAGLAGLLVLCYAEAASRFQGTGGAMRYAQAAFGDAAAFEVGWATWIARVASWAALGNAFVDQVAALWPGATALHAWLLVALIGGLTLANLRGVGVSGQMNTWLTVAKLVPLVVFVGIGLFHLESAHFEPFAPNGYQSLGPTTLLMLYAYVGFEGMVIPAAEMRDPQRSVPRALMLGMATIVVLYALIWTVCTGTFAGLAGSDRPVGDAATTFLGDAGGTFVQIGIVLSVLGINAFMALVTPRALYALGHEDLLPPWFGRVDRNQVPANAIWLTSVAVLALAWTGTFEQLAVVSVVARITQYIPTALAVLRLRRLPDLPAATFTVPLGPTIPSIAIAICAWLLWEAPTEKLLGGGVAVAIGLLPYAWWRHRRRR